MSRIGDTFAINLTSSSKIFAGKLVFAGGQLWKCQNVFNGSTNTVDPDMVDTPNTTI